MICIGEGIVLNEQIKLNKQQVEFARENL